LTHGLTYMAPQVDKVFPGEGRSILWFNNEGPGKRIKLRAYQSCLNLGMEEMRVKSQSRTLRPEYAKAVGGDENILKIYDIHDFWSWEIEDIIRQVKPAIVVFDMIDNIKFSGLANNGGQRTDQLLEAMYQWARVLAVKHDCIVMATSQISGDGEGQQYPALGMLKDSKTGKQGAADFILTIGYQDGTPDTRYLGLTKNKLQIEGGKKNLRSSVIFDGLRGRYNTPRYVEDPAPESKEDPLNGKGMGQAPSN